MISEYQKQRIKKPEKCPKPELPTSNSIYYFFFIHLLILTCYVFGIEILSNHSRQSFLKDLELLSEISLIVRGLFLSAVICGLITLGLLAISITTNGIIKKIHGFKHFKRTAPHLLLSFPFILFSLCNYAFIDRWTYSTLAHSMIDRSTLFNSIIVVIFILAGIGLYISNQKQLHNVLNKYRKVLTWAIALFLFAGGLETVRGIYFSRSLDFVFKDNLENQITEKRPANIIILSYDMLELTRSPMFGHFRNTTPNLLKRKNQLFLFSNAVAAGTNTRAGTSVFFTGKSPLTTKLYGVSDRLKGVHAFEHIPWILRSFGYYTANFSSESLSNPAHYNLANAFDQINDKKFKKDTTIGKTSKKIRSLLYEEIGFLNEIMDDLKLKFEYSFRISDALKTRKEVALIQFADMSFDNFFSELEDIVEKSAPFFVHFHSVATHTPIYHRKYKHFSDIPDAVENKCVALRKKNRACDGALIPLEERMAMYDDTLLQMDEEVEKVFQLLEKNRIKNNTLIILTTDHEYEWKTTGHPVGLVISVPNYPNGRIVAERVSLLDIAPTIIDFLGLNSIPWLEGQSLVPFYAGLNQQENQNRYFYIPKGKYGKLTHISVLKDNFRMDLSLNPATEPVFLDISEGYRKKAKKIKVDSNNKQLYNDLRNRVNELIHASPPYNM